MMIARGKSAARPTVLVVDDESGPREAFRLVLEDEFNVLTAESGWQPWTHYARTRLT